MIENCQLLTFKVNFPHQKSSESFSLFSLKNINLGAHFLLLTFFENFNFLSTLFTKIMPIFRSLDLEGMLIYQEIFLWKSAILHSIKLPFDVQAAEKILHVIYISNAYVLSCTLNRCVMSFPTALKCVGHHICSEAMAT